MNTFPPLILGTPGQRACPDEYTALATILCPGAVRLTVQTSVAAVFLCFGDGFAPVWGVEEPYTPFVGSLVRRFDAVKVRNFTAGAAAQVFLTAIPA